MRFITKAQVVLYERCMMQCILKKSIEEKQLWATGGETFLKLSPNLGQFRTICLNYQGNTHVYNTMTFFDRRTDYVTNLCLSLTITCQNFQDNAHVTQWLSLIEELIMLHIYVCLCSGKTDLINNAQVLPCNHLQRVINFVINYTKLSLKCLDMCQKMCPNDIACTWDMWFMT